MKHHSIQAQNFISLEELRAYHNERFIRLAYRSILDRPPRPDELTHFLDAIGMKIDAQETLHAIRQLLQDNDLSEANSDHKQPLAMRIEIEKKFGFEKLPAECVSQDWLDKNDSAEVSQSNTKNNEKRVNINSLKIDDEKEFPFTLKEILSGSSEVFWAGTRPPLAWMKASDRIFDPKFDYRLPADFHQHFNVVYLTERDLGSIKAWPMVLDEALRLLAPGGILLIRFNNTQFLSVHELKNIMELWGEIEIQFEHTYEKGPCVVAVKNIRVFPRVTNLNCFTFGVITDGKRPVQLDAFIKSVHNLERKQDERVEIIVCGPEYLKKELEAYGDDILLVVEPDQFKENGWITRKKNLITQASTSDNLIIVHDRYTVPGDFITNIQKYGGDYSVLACRHLQPDGRRVPDWVTLGGEWTLTTPATLEYGDWTPFIYLNGGVMIAKTEVLKKVRWNELLFWGQAEDVELTRRLRGQGYIPRLASNVCISTLPLRKGFTEGFEAIPMVLDKYMLPGLDARKDCFSIPTIKYGSIIGFGAIWGDTLAQMGVYVDTDWSVEDNYIKIMPNKHGEITFKLRRKANSALNVIMHVNNLHEMPNVLVNNHYANVEQLSSDKIRCVIPVDAITNNIIRIHIRSEHYAFSLKSLTVSPEVELLDMWNQEKRFFCTGSNAINALGNGWSNPEHWGCWVDGDSAELTIPIDDSNTDLIVEGTANAFIRPPNTETIIGVIANEMAIAHFKLYSETTGDYQFRFSIPKEIIKNTCEVSLRFIPTDPCSPLEIGLNNDRRRLSMGLISISVFKV